ncbi:MAG: hypothetical protein ABR920_01915 [Terriglobales bacterium]
MFGVLADRFGRRIPLMANVIYFAIIELLCGSSPNYTFFLVMRALFGERNQNLKEGEPADLWLLALLQTDFGACDRARQESAFLVASRLLHRPGRPFFSARGHSRAPVQLALHMERLLPVSVRPAQPPVEPEPDTVEMSGSSSPLQWTMDMLVGDASDGITGTRMVRDHVNSEALSQAYSHPFLRNTRSISRLKTPLRFGVDRMQRNFDPMRKQVEAWQRSELTDVTAKVVIYEAFIEGRLEAPKHLARSVHDLYFEPKYEEFRPRTIWSLSNAFTSAFKELDPIPQFKATAKLGES